MPNDGQKHFLTELDTVISIVNIHFQYYLIKMKETKEKNFGAQEKEIELTFCQKLARIFCCWRGNPKPQDNKKGEIQPDIENQVEIPASPPILKRISSAQPRESPRN